MFKFSLPKNPKAGDLFFDPVNDIWKVYTGKIWTISNFKEHKCSIDYIINN